MKKKIVLADDHSLFLEGIVGILSPVAEIEIVGRAHTGKEALCAIRSLMPDLALLDITMPEINGIELTRLIKEELPEIKVLILSMHLDKRMIIEVLKAGADGYALKEIEPEELIYAVKVIISGQMYLSTRVTTMLIRDYIHKLSAPPPNEKLQELSSREKEVLSLISEGKSAQDIARLLCISRNTVDSHRRNLMQKLKCDNLNELTRYAIREGIMNLD